ncbi:hypothetical protein CDAR_174441 [Caerostris darwini]|uniref:Uncharacterized protein n=1 Tax=Caerostris darwini TaxID=1538125 RepID=A0AAV4PI40_9ARAC|nr:hypothetical protein CDAR_174441 [Caerostris darwini]
MKFGTKEKKENNIRYVLDDDDVPTEIPGSRQKPIHQPNADPLSPQKARANYSSLSQKAQKFDADHCSSHHVRPDMRKTTIARMLLWFRQRKQMKFPAAISLCYLAELPHPTLTTTLSTHALARAQCVAGPANRALKWRTPGKNVGKTRCAFGRVMRNVKLIKAN